MSASMASKGLSIAADIPAWVTPIQDWKIQSPKASSSPRYSGHRELVDAFMIDARLGQGCTGLRKPTPYGFVVVVLMIDGRETGIDGLRNQTFEAGDVIVWNSFQTLQFEVIDALHKIMLVLPEKRVRNMWPDLVSSSTLYFSRRDPFSPLLSGYFGALLSQIDSLSDSRASVAIDGGLDITARAAREQRRDQPQDKSSLVVEQVIRYLEANLRDPELDLDRVATRFSLSARYLQILFARRGTTLTEWVRERRLENCRRALEAKKSDETITDIALDWGFNDPSHFGRLFRQRFGMTPKDYAFRNPAK